ncbi:MAG: hypothetical protein FWF15_10065, partial [Oscillospiraceae bacterium]|nr:hypothetical protein [Oscillospiraceae bacterium]
LNGDGVIDFNDVYAIGNDYTSGQFFYYATGEKIAVLDKDGSPKLTVGGERSITVMDKIIEIMNDKNLMIWTATIVRDAKVDGWEYLLKMFNENRLLIYQVSVFCIKELRGMFDDFAIVPHPKYNEFQDDYYMIVSTHRCPGVCIPVTNTELELTGIILEAMAYYSQPIQVAYYDVTLTEKFARDADSRDMLDIIFGGRTYDIGKTFGWGSYIVQMDTAINKNEAFASYYEANRTKAETEMQKSYGIFLEV